MSLAARYGAACLALVGLAVLAAVITERSQAGVVRPRQGGELTLRVGDRLPDVSLTASDGSTITLREAARRVTLFSIVPQLNTPVCDEQTHHFSEENGGLDRHVDIVTVSTNSREEQAKFAANAGITNIRFFSDAPGYAFGRTTGLLLPQYRVLHRAVMVVDAEQVIRYVELVPMGSLPNFDAAFDAAQRLVDRTSP